MGEVPGPAGKCQCPAGSCQAKVASDSCGGLTGVQGPCMSTSECGHGVLIGEHRGSGAAGGVWT